MSSDLHHLDISAASAGLRGGKFSSRELVKSCLNQIQKHNSGINAFLTLNEHALEEADQADINLPLGGIPMAIKDNFLTQGLRTTASSKVLDNYIPQYDSTVVEKLKKAGAIILGKTNMDAWAHGSSTETSDYGPTLNPWNTGHLPGGSSGGSAAAVRADMCTFAIGSETAGSIRQPAAWCGITGFKPTYGRISRYGVIAMASSTDSPGPLTKTAVDASTITSLLAGKDPSDATTIPGNYQKILPKNGKKLKIGVAVEYLLPQMKDEVKKLIREAAGVLLRLGMSVEDISLMDPNYSVGVYTIVQRSEVSSNLARYDGIRYGLDRSHFGEEAKRRIMLGTYTLSSGYYDQYYQKALKVRTMIIEDFNRAFRQVDLVIGATSPGPALKVGASRNQPMFGEMEDILVEPSSIAGLTGISVPCGFVDGLPIGLQIIGPQGGEESVFRVALEYQSAVDWHLARPSLT
ncbi:glutaminyl-tRNA synthase (glutamine-hydrolyzing) subunit A [Candidatus Amesbacteria bacterium RIFCSPHIGHO2_01_FULL_47_34]|uniref:Glutamyl-tRNA(Gln) amidotransferase subunit A n=4 Tax=Candidatus Amesiibacteriota TaxID=1752730 RepID=A0A1F4ZWR9_9BACT|nr:MAG: Glutamyl-tRNA(Gln) amidotransferase subunit A [Candidatus Amesbacteria bacterium GW2011_GWC1_47_15]KKU98182.1 MAG: Glutamyl-tRNA(Gln) amidotransferase subunit A [Candidatus Amesbacteria bacterium GW2011_GWB1_48_13]OGC99514.1 MAG: glutaminyl-tRNA synthase (glutamine-hydrolyzing) subunit A [Candidatus Amesbacteria bacterium RIFCSPHIGHO2_01_FULL_47_34]OGD01971.1 MAG: glutaminyl-tRNA synthase (glutamine-hydrolyzing) subunit A [Candidatus Amesbacteria bacterium RIFCSPLOWO2_01_FULL_47_33]OGD1